MTFTAWAPWASKEQILSDCGPWVDDDGQDKGCLHTTESPSWPSYHHTNPHLTARPNFAKKRLDWRQHARLDRGALALVNDAGGVMTNLDRMVQVELVGTCDPATHAAWTKAGIEHIYWPEAPQWALEDLAERMRWLEANNGIARAAVPTWLPYPASYGEHNGVRLSGKRLDEFSGWLGHQHISEGNVHGDPGKLDVPFLLSWEGSGRSRKVVKGVSALIGAILLAVGTAVATPDPHPAPVPRPVATARPSSSPTHAPVKSPAKVPAKAPTKAPAKAPVKKPAAPKPSISRTLRAGSTGADVKALQRALHVTADGSFGPRTRAAVVRAQAAHKLTRDGVVGPITARALGITYR